MNESDFTISRFANRIGASSWRVAGQIRAGELGVSKERVRQIREAAEKKLREDFIVLALWQSVLNRR